MRLPSWSELIEEQKQIYEFPLNKNLFVVGPPGSGKTTLAIQRATLLNDAMQPVTVITYNRMLRRLITLTTQNKLHARTMQSYVWRHYSSTTEQEPPRVPPNPYDYDWDKIIDGLPFCATQKPVRTHLVIDEGQDLEAGFFEYSHKYAATTITVFADEDQAINGNGSSLRVIKRAANLDDPIILTENHRNTEEISRIAEHFHNGSLPVARVRRKIKGTLPVLRQISSIDEIGSNIGTWYSNFGGSIGVIIARNNTGEQIQQSLKKHQPNTRIDIYTHGKCNEDQIDVSKPGITILNKESVKGQEFDTVFICELGEFLPCDTDSKKRAMYMMCCRARDHLILLEGPAPLSARAVASLPDSDILERE